jgi:putative oxidoreductase
MDFLRPFAPQLLSILRIMSGLIVLEHATAKYLNFPTHATMNNMNPMTPSGAAGIIEAVFGALLVIGLFSRFSAFILSGLCAVAYFYAHAPRGFFPLLNGGELAVTLTFLYLYLAAAGAGPWSVDRAIRGSDA